MSPGHSGLSVRVFSTHICFFSPPAFLGYYEKSHDICVFWSDKLISNFNAFNDMKITLRVYTRTSGETVRISDEAERVQPVSYSHIRPLSGLYTVVCLREDKQDTCWGPPLSSVMCKVAYLAFNFGDRSLLWGVKWWRDWNFGPPVTA